MAAQPKEEDINAFCALVGSGLDRTEAIARLKGNNNLLQQAINEYYDGDSSAPNKYRWDEEQFNSDRDGGYRNHGISFDIQGPDEPGPFSRFDGAPSRPPSRTSHNKSPLGKAVDQLAEDALGDSRNNNLASDEDRDLQQALAASMEEASFPPQESGVTANGTGDVHFGPANRPSYDQGKWDMVAFGKTTTQEILLDPEPADRKREPGVPAFLKPSIENHRLGALITIYHEIPLLREIFLGRLDTLQNYGYDKEWWSGKPIELPAIEVDGPETNHEVLQELQRLMAFLDKTERAYGSADALANLRSVKKLLRRGGLDLESAVFRAWSKIYQGNNAAVITKIFSLGEKPSANPENMEQQDFAILDLGLPLKDSLHETLYDVADEALWGDPQTLELSESAYLSHIADVIAFRLDGNESKKGIDVPAEWYPDRYLKSESEAALQMRLQKHEIDLELQRIQFQERLLTECEVHGKIVKVKDLFSAALQHDQAEIMDNILMNHHEENSAEVEAQRPAAPLDISAELRRVMDSIDKKLLALNEEKEKVRDALRELSNLYTDATATEKSLHKYTLRGVSTTKSTMYVCRRTEQDLIEMDVDGSHSNQAGDQWWKIQYATSGVNPITLEKTAVETVLQAVKSENQSLLLVYASEKALHWEPKPLPAALETFVRTDNETFRAELSDPVESHSTTTSPRSPGKRKYDERYDQDHEEQAPSNGGSSSKKQNENFNVHEREIGGSEDHEMDAPHTASRDLAELMTNDSRITNANNNGEEDGEHEVLLGVDPALLSSGMSEDGGENVSEGQEMQERRGSRLRILAGRLGNVEGGMEEGEKIGSMDMNGVLEDDVQTEESAAVKRVGFAAA